jgi:hypothetical protein
MVRRGKVYVPFQLSELREIKKNLSLVIDKGLFWSSFPMFILWLIKNGQCLSI